MLMDRLLVLLESVQGRRRRILRLRRQGSKRWKLGSREGAGVSCRIGSKEGSVRHVRC